MGQASSAIDSQKYEMLLINHNSNGRAAEDESTATNNSVPIFLTPYQSCLIHGWSHPKRILTWLDIQRNSRLTFRFCLQRYPKNPFFVSMQETN